MAHWGMTGTQVMEAIGRVRNPAKNPPSDIDKGIYKILTDLGAQTEMLDWMVEKSQLVVKAWRKKHPCDRRALMFLNNEFQDRAEIDEEVFRQLEHAKTVGDNRHRASNAVVFLVSLNPNQRLKTLLEARIGHLGYNVEDDFVIDRLIQASGRGNIRVAGIKDRMLIVVSTEKLATSLMSRMNQAPSYKTGVTQKLGNYMSWDYKQYSSTKLAKENPEHAQKLKKIREARKARRVKRELTAEEKRYERALYQKALRARYSGNMELHDKIEAERDALRFVSSK
jgi:hypothetical protein